MEVTKTIKKRSFCYKKYTPSLKIALRQLLTIDDATAILNNLILNDKVNHVIIKKNYRNKILIKQKIKQLKKKMILLIGKENSNTKSIQNCFANILLLRNS